MASTRMERVNSEIQKVLSEAIITRLADPALQQIITITGVSTTPDFAFCKVNVGVLADTNLKKKKVLEKLTKASGFLKKELADNLKLRAIPKLSFVLDENVEYSMHINEILKSLNIPKEEDDEDTEKDN